MTSYFTGGNSTFVGMSRFNNSPKVLTANEIVAENLNVKNIGGGSDDGGGGGGNGEVTIKNLNVLIELIANNFIVNKINLIPPGTIFTFATFTAPSGYLICDGSNLQISSYQDLYDAIGFIYNNSPPAGSFNIPDLRGYFVRGFDSTGVIDPGRVFGSSQIDQLKSHVHTLQAPGGTVDFNTPATGFNQSAAFYGNVGYTTDSTGGNETRPKNVAMLICIKT